MDFNYNYNKYYDNYVDDSNMNTWERNSYYNYTNEEILDDITSKNSKLHPQNHGSSYRFTKPTENSWYIKVLKYLMENGNASKVEILREIGVTDRFLRPLDSHSAKGYFSSMFAAMHQAGLISYKQHKITLGPNAEEYLRRNNFIN